MAAARIVGAYILAIVVLNVLVWLRTIVPAMLADDPTWFLDGTGIATNPVFVQGPGLLAAGSSDHRLADHWTRRPYGALLAGSYLVFGLLESIGVAVDQWMGYSADPTTPHATVGAVYLFAAMAVIGVGALAYYARSNRPVSAIRLSITATVSR